MSKIIAKGVYASSYFSFLALSVKVEFKMKEALKAFGITHAQLNVLHLLYNAEPEPMNAKELKEAMIVKQPDLTRMMDRLLQKELVSRAYCEHNRRQLSIKITAKGLLLFEAAFKEGKANVGHFFEDFISREEALQLSKIIHKIKL